VAFPDAQPSTLKAQKSVSVILKSGLPVDGVVFVKKEHCPRLIFGASFIAIDL
jgi:hypothetical protein